MIVKSNHTSVDLKLKIAETRTMLFDNTRELIRKQFDRPGLTSLEAEALIYIAKEKGLHEMALEMESDLHVELLEV